MNSWDEIEKQPEFGLLNPEDKRSVHDAWKDSVLSAALEADPEQINPEGVHKFVATSEARSKALAEGGKFDEQEALKSYQKSITDRTAAQNKTLADYDEYEASQFALMDAEAKRDAAKGGFGVPNFLLPEGINLPVEEARKRQEAIRSRFTPGVLEQAKAAREAIRGERPVAQLDTDLYTDPALTLNKDEYRKAVVDSDASIEAKAKAIADFAKKRDAFAKAAVRTLNEAGTSPIPGAADFPTWESRLPPAEYAKSPEEKALQYLREMKGRDGFRKVVSAVATGAMQGGVDIASQGIGLAALATQSPELAAKAAEVSKGAETLQQAQKLEGDMTATGATTAGGVARLGTGMAPAIAGSAVTGGGLAAASLLAGAQTTGAQFPSTFAALKEQGKTDEEALRAATGSSLLAGAITTSLTAMGGPTGVEALVRQGGKELAKRELVKRIAGGALKEIPEEVLDEAASQIIEAQTTDPEKPISQTVDEFAATVPDLALQVALLGGASETMQAFREGGGTTAQEAGPQPVAPTTPPDTDFAQRAAMEGATEFRDTTAGRPVVVNGITIANIPPESDLTPDDVTAFVGMPDESAVLKRYADQGRIVLPEIVKPVEGVDSAITEEMNANIAAGAATAPATVKALEEAQARYDAEAAARAAEENSKKPNDLGGSMEALASWDRANKNKQGNLWFEEAHGNTDVTGALNRAAPMGGADLATHGMAKRGTLTQTMRDLLDLLRNGTNPNKNGGVLHTAPLAIEAGSAGANAGTTASGTSYRDGPFILVNSAEASRSQAGIRNMETVQAVLVNDANAAQLDAVRELIHSVRPDIIVELYSRADVVAAQLTGKPQPTQTNAPDQLRLEEGVREEPAQGDTGRETKEAGARDSVLGAAKSEEVAGEGSPIPAAESVPLDQLTVIPEDYARAQADRDANNKRWQESSKSNEPVTAIRLPDGTLRIMDGHHRYLAAQERGDTSLPVLIEPSPPATTAKETPVADAAVQRPRRAREAPKTVEEALAREAESAAAQEFLGDIRAERDQAKRQERRNAFIQQNATGPTESVFLRDMILGGWDKALGDVDGGRITAARADALAQAALDAGLIDQTTRNRFQPAVTTATETPSNRAKVAGGSQGVQTEPAEGSIPAVTTATVPPAATESTGEVQPAKEGEAKIIDSVKDADLVLRISRGRNYYTLWFARKGFQRGYNTYLTVLSTDLAEAREKAVGYLRQIASGEKLSIAFAGKKQAGLQGAKTVALDKGVLTGDELETLGERDTTPIADKPIGFGKYAGVLLKDIIDTDFGYATWLADSARENSVREYLNERPEILEMRQSAELEKERVKAFEEREAKRKEGKTVPVATLVRGDEGVITAVEEPIPEQKKAPKLESRKAAEQIVEILPPQSAADRVSPSLKQAMFQSQIDGANATIDSMVKNGVALNSDGAGVGKTRQIIAVADYFAKQGKPVVIISENAALGKPWEGRKIPVLGGSMAKDSQTMGVPLKLLTETPKPGEIVVSTYNRIEAANVPPGAVVIFDESQWLANTYGNLADQGKEARKWQEKFRAIIPSASSVAYYTATPADKPHQLAYLHKVLGFGTPEEYLDEARRNGVVIIKSKYGGKEVSRYDVPFSQSRKKKLYQWLNNLIAQSGKEGRVIKREISYEGTDVQFHDTKGTDSGKNPWAEKFNDVVAELNQLQSEGWSLLNPTGAILYAAELAKIGDTVNIVKREIAAGRKAVVFFSRVNPFAINGRKYFTNMMGEREPGPTEELGSIPSPLEFLMDELRKEGISFAELHSKSKTTSQKAQKEFASDKDVLIASVESGGTGINLDDSTGKNPRTEVFMYYPYRGISTIQAMGRIWRASTVQDDNKPNRFVFITASDIGLDASRSAVLAKKLQLMNATLGGTAVSKLPLSKVSYNKEQLAGIEIADDMDESTVFQDRYGTLKPVKVNWTKTKAGDRYWSKASADLLEWWERGGPERTGLDVEVFKSKDSGDWIALAGENYPPESFVEKEAPATESPPAAPRNPAENLVSFTAANGQKLVGEVQSVTGNKATVAYSWNGKTKTQVVPVSQLGSPVASVATPPKYLYNQEQNTRKLGKHFPTSIGVHANHDFRKSFASMAEDTSLSRTYRMVAKVLAKMPEFEGIDLHLVADENIKYAGEYSWNNGKPSIAINLRYLGRGKVDALGSILHEALHHVTLAKVRNPQGAYENEVVGKLDAIREKVIEYAESKGLAKALDYELGSLEEFITATFTHPDFQAFLASIPESEAAAVAVGKFRSILSEIFRRIAELVTGKPVLRGSALEQAMATSLALFNTPFRGIETGGLEALNAARSYAGERAQMPQFMRDSLETAQAMAAAGKTSEEIRAVTGWFPGKYDGKMRWEIPDEGATWTEMARGLLQGTGETQVRLSDVLKHDALFDAYPDLKNVVVSVQNLGTGDSTAEWVPYANAVILNRDILRGGGDTISAVLHELQHAIQGVEGFAKGASPGSYVGADKFYQDWVLRAELVQLADETGKTLSEAVEMYKDFPDEYASLKNALEVFTPESDFRDSTKRNLSYWKPRGSVNMFDAYNNTAGEIEARDVQARQAFTPEQRKAVAPYSSENIAKEDAIVMFGGSGAQASMGKGLKALFPQTGDKAAKPSALAEQWWAATTRQEARAILEPASLEELKAIAVRMDENPNQPKAKLIDRLVQITGVYADAVGIRGADAVGPRGPMPDYTGQTAAAQQRMREQKAARAQQPKERGLPKAKPRTPEEFARDMAALMARPASETKPINLSAAYQKATVGKSSRWVTIKEVYEQAKADNPSLTPEAFMAQIEQQNETGGVMISPVENVSTVEAARPFVVGNAGVEMLVPGGTAASRIDEETDAEYLAAVEAGDMEKAQAMVDAAAKAAGYETKAWHGSPDDEFTVFKKPEKQADEDGFWFSKDREWASKFGPTRLFYIKDIKTWGGDDFVVKDPNSIKSADPVTYDEQGNVIPLSQRFNPESPSIAYSRVDEGEPPIDIGGVAEPADGGGTQLFQKRKTAIGSTYITPADITLQDRRPQEETLAKARKIIAEEVLKDEKGGRAVALQRFKSDLNIPPEVRAAGTGLIAQQADLLANLERDAIKQEGLDALADEAGKVSGIISSDFDHWRNLQLAANLDIDKMAEEAGRTLNIFNVFRRLTPEGFLRRMKRQYNDSVRESMAQTFELPSGDVEEKVRKAVSEKPKDPEKAVKDLLKKLKPKPRAPREKIEKSLRHLFAAAEAGALDSQEFFDALGEALGHPPLTTEQQAKIKRLTREINSLPKGAARIDKQQELDEELALWKGIAARDVLLSAWYANILSGISTQGIGLFGNLVNFIPRSLFLAATNPRSAKAFFEGALGEGLKTGIREAQAALKGRGLYKVSKYGDKNMVSALELLRKKGPATLPEWIAYIASAGTRLRYVFRIMQAIDALAWNTAREGQAYLAAHRALLDQQKMEGTQRSPEEFYRTMIENLGGDTKQIEEDLRAARETLIAAGQTPDLLTVDRMAREARNARRSSTSSKLSNRFADRIVMQQEPEGIGDTISSIITVIQKKGNIAGIPFGQLLIPFNKIVANLFEQSLDYTPIGALRAYLGGHLSDLEPSIWRGKVQFKDKAVQFDAIERAERTAASITGTLAASAMYAIASLFKDDPDEDVPFMLYGLGPESKSKRDQMPKGWTPYSAKIGDTYIKFSEMPFGVMFAAAGNALDVMRYKNMDKKSSAQRLAYVLKASAKGFTEQGVLSSFDTAFEAMTFKASDKRLMDVPVNIAKGMVPGQGMLRDMSVLFDPVKIKDDTVAAALLRDFPVVRRLGTRPALNVFGEPVTFDGRIPFVRRLVTGREKHAASDYLGRNGLSIPGMAETIVVGQYLPKDMKDRIQRRALETSAMENGVFTVEQDYAFRKRAGELTKVAVENLMEQIPAITTDKQRENVQNLINRKVDIARRRAMLEAVPAK